MTEPTRWCVWSPALRVYLSKADGTPQWTYDRSKAEKVAVSLPGLFKIISAEELEKELSPSQPEEPTEPTVQIVKVQEEGKCECYIIVGRD